ncbi:acyl carrier protein [Streptosporangium canum]|uniref:acyl carrier protein n=1 Tax=Streptosporangium canum TaxID=324952 RepID=UPI0037BA510E
MNRDLATILTGDLKLSEQDLIPGATLEDAGVDSLAIVELSILLGERLGLDVSEADIKGAATLDQLDQLIQRKRNER